MTLIYACIAPHAGDLIPETVEDNNKVTLTRHSMQEMGANLEALSPEVIVIVNPHGFRVQNAMSISIAERAMAEWSRDVKLKFDLDLELANHIADRATEVNGPYGFGPASAQYDTWMQEIVKSDHLDALLTVDPKLVEGGKPDSLWPTLVLEGALKENRMQVRFLSYEVNVYFGILCAEFLPV